jgi:hypothetical protein
MLNEDNYWHYNKNFVWPQAVYILIFLLSRKTVLLNPSESYQKDGKKELTLSESMWSMYKCDYVALIIVSRPVFQASHNNFWMTLALSKTSNKYY